MLPVNEKISLYTDKNRVFTDLRDEFVKHKLIGKSQLSATFLQ